MLEDLLVNSRTKKKLQAYAAKPSQALLITGPAGAGKRTLAATVAANLLRVDPAKLDDYAYFVRIGLPEGKQEIPVDSIRELRSTLRLQVPGNAPIRRVALIEDAQLMNQEAQNAFLKSLEEPAPGTVFILTADSSSGMLATIVSRTASVEVDPLSLNDSLKFFSNHPESEVKAAWALSQGLPGLMNALLSSDENTLRESVSRAKDFLGKQPYERLLALEGLKDKQETIDFLDALARVLKALYRSAAARDDKKSLRRVADSFSVVSSAVADLQSNVTLRLVTLNLVLSLSV
ncbi:MAG TPA: hypothetical protein VG964_03435 [Candidatus Saccharimonadales bacterium]|nr:hypothetical protein [Candidatus Saccharimonadales bacterium]